MNRIKELRKKRMLTQEELINQFNAAYGKAYAPSSISQIENGKRIPETQTLIDFADFFGVSLDYLLGRPGNAAEYFTRICIARKDLTRREVAEKLGLTAKDLSILDRGDCEDLSPEATKKIYAVYVSMNTPHKINVDHFKLAQLPTTKSALSQQERAVLDAYNAAPPDKKRIVDVTLGLE